MGRHHPDLRRLKRLQPYTITELAAALACHKRTVMSWRKQGLEPGCAGRPMLFLGAVVIDFLKARQAKAKQPCGPGQVFCLPCGKPQTPAGGMADYQPSTVSTGMLSAHCPDCHRLIFQRANGAKLEVFRRHLTVTVTNAPQRIAETVKPFLNCPFNPTGET